MVLRAELTIKGELLDLPNRHKDLPKLYRWHGRHLYTPDLGENTNTTYVALLDDSPEGLKRLNEYIKVVPIPTVVDDETLHEMGYVRMWPGDCLITRLLHGSGEEEDDRLEGWFFPVECLPPDFLRDILELQSRLLGPADDSREAGVKGGIPIEKDECQHNIRNAPRCYNESVALQVPKMTITPVQGTLLEMEDEHAMSKETRRLILKVAGEVAAHSIETAAPHAAKMLRDRADALNLPRVGCAENFYCPAVQLNISPAQVHDPEQALKNFQLVQGAFGIKHIDKNDELLAYTNLLAASQLLGGEDPGRFYLAAYAVYIVLLNICSFAFCGRHGHGGFPPTAQPGKPPDPRSCRVVLVAYPPKAQFDAHAKFTFAHTPDGELNLCREWYDPQHDDRLQTTQSVSMIQNGSSIMDEKSHMEYFGRGVIQLLEGLRRQLPPGLEVQYDVDSILGAISYQPSDLGTRLALPPWPLAPGRVIDHQLPTLPAHLGSGMEVDSRAERKRIVDGWLLAHRRVRPFFPELGDKWSDLRVLPWNAEDDPTQPPPLVDFEFDEEFEDDRAAATSAPERRTTRGSNKRAAPPVTSQRASKRSRHTYNVGVIVQKNMSQTFAQLSLAPSCIPVKMPVNVRVTSRGQSTRKQGGHSKKTRRDRSKSSTGRSGAPEITGHRRSTRLAASRPRRNSTTENAMCDDSSLSSHRSSSPGGNDEGAGDTARLEAPRRHIAALTAAEYDTIYRESEAIASLHAETTDETPQDDRPLPDHSAIILPEIPIQISAEQPPRKRTRKHREPEGEPESLTAWLERVFCLSGLQTAQADMKALVQRAAGTQTGDDTVAHRVARQVIEGSGQWKAFDASYVNLLHNLWQTVDEEGDEQYLRLFHIRLARAHVLAAVGAAWTWLDHDLPAMTKGCLEGDLPDVPQWLKGLIVRVRDYLLSDQPAKFNTEAFGLTLPGAPPVECRALGGPVARDCLETRIMIEVRAIVMKWLRYPIQNYSRIRGTFVRILISKVGDSAVLLLPNVQAAFLRLRPTILPKAVKESAARNGDPSLLDDFGDRLGAMAVTQVGSEEHQCLVAVGEVVYNARERIRKMLHPSLGSHGPQVDIDPEVIQQRISAAIQTMLTFLNELYPVLLKGELPVTPIQVRAASDPDFFSPFRQLAPQVRRVSGPGSFLHPEMINKPGAVASHYSWRGAFYRSEYSKTDDCRLFFMSAADWEGHREQLKRRMHGLTPPHYFCNPQAYGTASFTRSDVHIPRYFAAEEAWHLLLSRLPRNQTQVDYRTAFKFTQEPNRLPGVGRLTGMLISSDLVYAGLVKMPTEEELGLLISHLSMGALSAVNEFLSLGRNVTPPPPVVQDVFAQVYRGVWDGLEEHTRAVMLFDPIMFEHALCKYSRLYHSSRT